MGGDRRCLLTLLSCYFVWTWISLFFLCMEARTAILPSAALPLFLRLSYSYPLVMLMNVVVLRPTVV